MKKTQRSWLISLAVFELLAGCAVAPVSTAFDGKWVFIDQPGQPLRACLVEDEVAQLRKILLECKAHCEEP